MRFALTEDMFCFHRRLCLMWAVLKKALALSGIGLGLSRLAVEPSQALALSSERTISSWEWRQLSGSHSEGPTTAVAWYGASERTAISDGRGVWVGNTGSMRGREMGRRYSGVGVVADLFFEDDGGLWIASENGLWFLTAGDRLENRFPAAGQTDRRMYRVAALDDWRVAVGESGAFVSVDGRVWIRLSRGLPLGPFYALALRKLPGPAIGIELWLGGAVDVWRLAVQYEGGKVTPVGALRIRPAGRPLEDRPVDLALGLGNSEVVILYPQTLARSLTSADGSLGWEMVFPVWSPGSRARRLFGVAEQIWVATDQGLLRATQWPRVWRRTTGPPGLSGMWSLAELGGSSLLAAGAPGTFLGLAREESRGEGPNTNRLLWKREPSLRQVQIQVLMYTGLRPDYFKRLRSGLSRRGWWPRLELDAAVGYDRSRREDEDQSFTYGELRDLRDRGRVSSRDFEAVLSLSWDLGEIAYPSDVTELSREARQRVSLRDNVLDEVNQLYFDRERARQALLRFVDRSDPEAVALRIRIDELAAGLDAWTGGWFSERVRASEASLRPSDFAPRSHQEGMSDEKKDTSR